jgi:4-amino-4-deoxy-L-arabinose transferase-like glycosyltransferase
MSRRNDWPVLILLFVLVTGRVAFAHLAAIRPGLAIANDTDRYVPLAESIVSGKAFAWNTESPGLLLNTVGYPLFLAGVFAGFGNSEAHIATAQLVISGLLVLALYLSLVRFLGIVPAFVASLLLGLDPLTILWSLTILTETLLACVLGLAILFYLAWTISRRYLTLFLAGLFSGLACLVKPYVLPVILLWAVAILFVPKIAGRSQPRHWSIQAKGVLLFALPVIMLIAPWYVRNSLLWKCPALSSVDRVTMRDYIAAKVIAEFEHLSLEDAQAKLRKKDPGYCPQGSIEYAQIALSHPDIYTRLHVAGTIPVLAGTSFDRWIQYFGGNYQLPDLWRPFMDNGAGGLASVLLMEWKRSPGALLLMSGLVLFQLVIYLLALIGVFSFRRTPSPEMKWNIAILVISILLLILSPGQGGHERFRVPAQPLLVILAGFGIAWTIQPRLSRCRTRRTTAEKG